jgi:hypothetical protein
MPIYAQLASNLAEDGAAQNRASLYTFMKIRNRIYLGCRKDDVLLSNQLLEF